MASLKLKFNTLRVFHPLLFFFFFFFVTLHSDDKYEREYMLRLMKAITPTPSNWSDTRDVCNWSGVICDYNFIDHIDLNSMSLTGTFPSGLNDSLTFITRIDLSNNSLSGPVPSLANLLVLHDVDLSGNNFTSIPDSCFQDLIGLQTLYLSNNVNLKPWKFPTHLTDSSALAVLDLRATNLMGSLPNIFHSFPNLLSLVLYNNRLSGVLPESFAHSKIVMLFGNDQNSDDKLSGTIKILSYMTHLKMVWLEGNNFEGPIPDLSNCTNMEELRLQDNLLTGIVPTSLMNLPLEAISLGDNWLQGPLPVFNKSVDVSLDVNTSNAFCLNHTGPCDQRVNTLLDIAAEFGYPLLLARSWRGNNPCKGWRFITCDGDGDSSIIRIVNLTKLNLNGTISTAFGNLTGLQQLYLNGNNLQGSIPGSLATLPQLEFVDVSYNNLSGTVPKFSHNKVKINTKGNALLHHPKESRTTLWITGVSCTGVIIIFVVVIYVHKRSLSINETLVDKKFEDFMKNYDSLTLKRYSYSEIKRMTNSFTDKLGQGGYGIVYKASLIDGQQVAVKVLNESNGTGEEFINEVASISRTSHVNVVSLLGFCYEKNKRALIYEFMCNGSLDKFIYKKGSSNASCDLNWDTLFQITISIARGLEYLHRGCNIRILHLDLKPQNILLDEDFCPKIADFGLAKVCKKKESVVSMLGTRGTPGYIAPEIFSRTYGGVSHKSDVYSYGMLILEVVGGRKNYDTGDSNEMYFPDWIYKDLEEGNVPSGCLVHTEEESDIVMKITLVSMWCIQPNPADRPPINKVVEMLEGSVRSIPYPPKPVLYSPHRSSLLFSNISDSNVHETISTITASEYDSVRSKSVQ